MENPSSNIKNALSKKKLGEMRENSPKLKLEKNLSKQILAGYSQKKDIYEVLNLDNTKLKSTIIEAQEKLLKPVFVSGSQPLKPDEKRLQIEECTANMIKLYNVLESNIKFSQLDDIKIKGVKYHYHGFQLNNQPQDYGILVNDNSQNVDHRDRYEGLFEKGVKNDTKAKYIRGKHKYIGGFISNEKNGQGEQFEMKASAHM